MRPDVLRILRQLLVLAGLGVAVWAGFYAWEPARAAFVFHTLIRDDPERRPWVARQVLAMGTPALRRVFRTLEDPSEPVHARLAAARLLRVLVEDRTLFRVRAFKVSGQWMALARWVLEEGRTELQNALYRGVLDPVDAVAQEASDTLYLLAIQEPEFFDSRADRDRIAACASFVLDEAREMADPTPRDLLAALASPEAAVRVQALVAILRYRLSSRPVRDAVLLAARAPSQEGSAKVRRLAAGVLGTLGVDPAVRGALRSLLADDRPWVVIEAARALGRVGGAGEVATLVEAMDSPSHEVRSALATALGRITARQAAAERGAWDAWWREAAAAFDPVAARRQGLRSADAPAAADAALWLGHSRLHDASAALLEVLAGPLDALVRVAAAEALGLLESVQAVPRLIDALEDPDAAVRVASDGALRRVTGHDFGFTRRRGWVVEEADERTRMAAVQRWREWWAESRLRSREEWLIRGLPQMPPAMKILALDGLARVAADGSLAMPQVVRLLDDPEPEVRLAALETAQALGPDPRLHPRRLLELVTGDPAEEVQELAVQVLLELEGKRCHEPLMRLLREGGLDSDAIIHAVRALPEEDLLRYGVVEANYGAEDLVTAIARSFRNEDPEVRSRMAYVVGALAAGLPEAVRAAEEPAAGTPAVAPGGEAGRLLLDAIRTRAVPALLDALRDRSQSVRFAGLHALLAVVGPDAQGRRDERGYRYELGPEENADAIRRWEELNVGRDLGSADPGLRLRGLQDIERSGNEGGHLLPVTTLLSMVRGDPSDELRYRAAWLLMKRGDRAVARHMAAIFHEDNVKARLAVTAAVRDLGWIAILPVLDDHAKDPQPTYARQAIEALGLVGEREGLPPALAQKYRHTMPTLFDRLLDHEHPELRSAAQDALVRILGSRETAGYRWDDRNMEARDRAALAWKARDLPRD
ncbi:MAG: HEAT repeat domain-containing protein [Planctomycetes bacterium]|nr:HEAT repeat domain-containing protein [Planctomycetota bacterium]